MATVSTISPWVAASQPSVPARLRLFCLPYAGGGASMFHAWARSLPANVAVHPIQLPGRESRLHEPAFTRIGPLVQELAEALLPHCDLPFALFGHSMGALISFELARALREQYALTPAHLFVSAHRAPQIPNPEPAVYLLPEQAFVEKLRRMNGTARDVLGNAELMALLLPTLRADFTICGTYIYASGPPLDCPISAFAGTQDPIASYAQVEAWREQTRQTFSLRLIPGNHFFPHSAQPLLLWTIGQELRQIVDAASEHMCYGHA
jgi:medium-chain acyl-[acyl-carrier-protein] hydrolase